MLTVQLRAKGRFRRDDPPKAISLQEFFPITLELLVNHWLRERVRLFDEKPAQMRDVSFKLWAREKLW
jgi:hypothetical protein